MRLKKTCGPLVATVNPTNAAIPTGAREITNWVMRIMTSQPVSIIWVMDLRLGASILVRNIPNKMEKRIIPNMSKVAAASNTLEGTMLTKTSQNEPGG